LLGGGAGAAGVGEGDAMTAARDLLGIGGFWSLACGGVWGLPGVALAGFVAAGVAVAWEVLDGHPWRRG